MNLFESLLEALNYKQEGIVDDMRRSAGYYSGEAHNEVFDRYPNQYPNRIVLPLEKPKTDADPEIRKHLAKNGWFVHNYTEGLAGRYMDDMYGNKKLQLKSIGKVLNETGGDKVTHSQPSDRLIKGLDGKPVVGVDGRMKSESVPQSLLHFYNNDPKRNAAKHEMNMVVSRGISDIGGMTSGRSWEPTSCMRLPHSDNGHPNCKEAGVYYKKIKQDFKHHSLVVYAAKKGDDELENPTARILLKKFVSKKGHAIYRTDASATYGKAPAGFKDAVDKFASDNWPAKDNTDYKLASGLYMEGREHASTPFKTGLTPIGGGHQFLNNRGNRHDYVDEHGVTQPAFVQNMDGVKTTIHYKDGEKHNEHGAAQIEEYKNGTTKSYYVNGKLHNPNGASVKFEGKSDNIVEQYHIDGMLHRLGDKPASEIKRHGFHEKIYSVYGLQHREGDKPSYTKINKDGEKETRYHKYGELHRDGDKPASTTIAEPYPNSGGIRDNSSEYYQHGKLHREGDKPASIKEHAGIVTKTWYKNGLQHRDGDKPSEVQYDKLTGKILSKSWHKNGEFSREGNKPVSISQDIHGNTKKTYKLPNGGLHQVAKDSTGTRHLWASNKDGAEIAGNRITAIRHGDFYQRYHTNLVTDENGNIHVTSSEDSMRASHPVIMKDGSVKHTEYDTEASNGIPTPLHKLNIVDLPNGTHDNLKQENLKELRERLRDGISNPYVGKHFIKQFKRVKEFKGLPLSMK